MKPTPPRNARAFFLFFAGFFLLSCSTGCHFLRKPDLSQTTGIAQNHRPQRPLILIHGFLGSKLRNPGSRKVAWGKLANVLSGRVNARLALPLFPDDPYAPKEKLVPFEIYDSLWGVKYYSSILGILQDAGGYQLGDIDDPQPGDNAFVFVYDWRKDNVESARLLAKAIDGLKARIGNPDQKFDLLAHSQGGLIARYYVKYGGQDVLEGTNPPGNTRSGALNVARVIMLGTPNQGSLHGLKILHLGVKKFFRPMTPGVVFTMPSLFQLLPSPETVRFATLDGTPVHLDIYDAQTWVKEGWSVFSPKNQKKLYRKLVTWKGDTAAFDERNRQLKAYLARTLERSARFQRALNLYVPEEAGVSFHAFGSDCIPTLKTAVLLQEKGRREILFDADRFRKGEIGERISKVLYGAGDGTVLMESLLDIPGGTGVQHASGRPGAVEFDSVFFVCENHGLLPTDPYFQNNLLYLLLWEETRPARDLASSSFSDPTPDISAPREGLPAREDRPSGHGGERALTE